MDEQLPPTRPVSGGTRKHMGVATSDPEYLPPVGGRNRGYVAGSSSAPRGGAPGNRGGQAPSQLNYSRYISTPKRGRAIFTSRQDRQRRRLRTIMGVLIVAAIVLALIWVLFLR